MKTAKEWAESVARVDGVEATLKDGRGRIRLDGEKMYPDEEQDTARGIVERLVERAQADARAPLEEEIARLRAEAAHGDRLIGAWIASLGGVRDALRRALRSGTDLATSVRNIIDGIEEQLRL